MTLDSWIEQRPPLAPEQLRSLAQDRVSRVAAALLEEHGIEAGRITRGESPAGTTEEDPVVRIQLHAVEW
ncbi:MAG: hypothetical protein HY699_23760 [Deltaproteobacteria bacterium]|nr:hypothetical protein [Deltaproteobacteria bacterium]